VKPAVEDYCCMTTAERSEKSVMLSVLSTEIRVNERLTAPDIYRCLPTSQSVWQGSLTPNKTKLSIFQPLSPVTYSKRRRSPIRSPTLSLLLRDRSQTRAHIRSRAIKNVFQILLSIRSFISKLVRVRILRKGSVPRTHSIATATMKRPRRV
jgi:hypothetical protein